MQGFLNLNKPLGWTSHDCVAKVRRLLNLKKVGHGGTLDPAASGVLPIAVGRATRLIPYLAPDKAYRAVIRFGLTTTTDDLEGAPLHTQPVPWLSREAVEAILPQFQGQIQQIPPSYSAIQVQGKRLYDLARAGQAVQAPVRTVEVYRIRAIAWSLGDFPELTVEIDCGAGTYIRSIARDIGNVLQTGATLAALTRTRSSGFQLEDSLTLDQVAAQMEAGSLRLISPDLGLQHLPVVTLIAAEAKRWQQGQKIETDLALDAEVCRIHAETGQFLGISKLERCDHNMRLLPKMVFVPAS